jgi:chromosome segregation ATPase
MSGSASTTSPRSESLAYHLKDLQNEIKSQQREIKGLKKEIDVLQEQVKVKDELIESWTAKERLLEERALEAETEVKSWKKRSKKWDEERRRLQAETDAANSEADRLNQSMLASAGNNSKAMNGSMEDVVRLHNQLSESRKDIHRLKDEIKSLENMIKAKDAAIEEGQAQIEMAVEANAMRQHDQNIIIDLNRQIKDLQEQLGGEHQYGKLAESEIGEIRNALAQKDAEMEELLEALEGQREEVREAKELKAHADSLIAQAAEKMARSVQISEKAVAAEAERMAAGGFVPKDVHDVELASVRSELDSYKEIVRSIKEENVHAKVFLKRLTGSVGDEIDKVVCSQEVAEQFGNSMFTIKELKSEVKSLQDIVASKEGVILAMQASKAAADVRATQLAVECTNMKMHLAKVRIDA